VARTVHLAMAVAARRAVADTPQGAVVTPPAVAADTPAVEAAAILVAEVIRAEVIAKKLGDSKSLREAARCKCS
jgi:hypothetical protein